MITINIPDNFVPERTYIINVLFNDFLGLEFKVSIKEGIQCYEIILENSNTLVFKDRFFLNFRDGIDYLVEQAVPCKTMLLTNQFAPEKNIPVIFGSGEISVEKNRIVCGIDIFASSFFMLTRWEEYANKSRDSHNRFPASESLAYKEGFLNRAVVNEYVEMVWNMLIYLKCGQMRKERKFKTILTHDVDAPFLYATKSLPAALKQMGGDLLKRKDPRLAFNNFSSWSSVIHGGIDKDPFNTFDYIMDVSERSGLNSCFLFITDCSYPSHDGDGAFGHRLVRRLIGDMHSRGHEIGLHASYGSFDQPAQTKKEIDLLKTICGEEGIDQQCWTSRQHFLRWDTPTTFDNLELAHLDFDSTLSYADVAGFRCGVCYEYPVFNILKRQKLNLRERPLLVMECTVIDERYMNLGAGEKAFSFIKSIKDTCRKYSGDFVVLWHNTRFIDKEERSLYNLVLRA
jgi:hypothetical protein